MTRSIAAGYMTRCEMVWTTAGVLRTCSRCLELKDKVVGYTDDSGVTLPPLHPRCRCAIIYREVKPDKLLSAPPNKPANTSSRVLTSRHLVSCKTFEELKLYWSDNYNVKVAPEISRLHFESVRSATAGIEAVLKEFPQAGFYLKELSTFEAGVMCTANDYSRINFNPRYFANPARLAKVLDTGYYIKNMNAFGAGAHEAGHLIERRLTENYKLTAREIVLAAYGECVRSRGFKPLKVLVEEVSTHSYDKGFNECLADAVADCVTNGQNAATLSQFIWRILKGESPMVAYSELQVSKFTFEEFDKYVVRDEYGCEAIGVKDDAPEEFKKAWLADKKMYDDAAKKGVIL